jgi:small subunit ribosomal protein S2
MNELIRKMFDAGAHYGYSKATRHPSAEPFVYGTKDGMEIIDLESTAEQLSAAKEFVAKLAADKKQLLFVSSKPEARESVEVAAEKVDQPYIAGRWVGGILTNIEQIQKRIKKLADLKAKRDKGELTKYTKKEQLLISREIDDLENRFGGIANMKGYPTAMFVVDPKAESIAVKEAVKTGVPVIAILNTDCSSENVDYPIYANDANRNSIKLFVDEIANAYEESAKQAK